MLRLELLQQLKVPQCDFDSAPKVEVGVLIFVFKEQELRLLPPQLRIGLLLALPHHCNLLLHSIFLAQKADGAPPASLFAGQWLQVVEEALANGNHTYLRTALRLGLGWLVTGVKQFVVLVDGGEQLEAPHHVRRVAAQVFGQALVLLFGLSVVVIAVCNHVRNDFR